MGSRDEHTSDSESGSVASARHSPPPRKKSRKPHKDSTRAGSVGSGTDAEKENRRKRRRERRRRRDRERLARPEEGSADADTQSAPEDGPEEVRQRTNREEGDGWERRRDWNRERQQRHRHRDRDRDQQGSRPDGPVRVKQEPESDAERDRSRRREERRRRPDHAGTRRETDRSRPDHAETKRETDHSRTEDAGRWGLTQTEEAPTDVTAPADKEAPNFGLSGKLAEDTNTVNGVVVKYSEPPEARKPKRRWRLYVFKGEESMPTLHIHRQSAFLMGRDRKVADIPIDHPSCSKQHAVLQYRLTANQRADGTTGRTVRPYIIDLESANGTYVNNQRIDAARYVELMERDVVKFGFSSREYVLLHDTSQGSGSGSD